MTSGVQWQYCGRLGKTANCVVTVQLAFSSYDTRFRTMLDTELFLPESWSTDRERCRKAGIPDHVVYRPKHHIALELLDRAEANGVHLEWITADIWYSEKPDFLAGLDQRNRRNVSARRLLALARRTLLAGQEKRAGRIEFRSPQIKTRDAPLVYPHG